MKRATFTVAKVRAELDRIMSMDLRAVCKAGRRPIAERFAARVDQRGPNECWPWKGVPGSLGYGTISKGGKGGQMLAAHRVAWELSNGPIPKGLHVLHRCDNRICVNPAHLYVGTHQDNMRDRQERGRTHRPKSEACALAKLTNAKVAAIKARLAKGEQGAAIAKDFGVSQGTVSAIKLGRTWKEVLPARRKDDAADEPRFSPANAVRNSHGHVQ